jgi:hypothetical protein
MVIFIYSSPVSRILKRGEGQEYKQVTYWGRLGCNTNFRQIF